MRLVGSIQWLVAFIIGICKYRDHSAEQIPSKEEYCMNSILLEVLCYTFVMFHHALIKHPFEPNSSVTLILGSTTEPIKIVYFIQSLCNCRNICPSPSSFPPSISSPCAKNSIKTIIMDREQEAIQFLGVFGTYKEAYKIIFSWRKIFSQITLALILPLYIIILAHIEISNLLSAKIINNEVELGETEAGTNRYNKLSDRISSELAYVWLFRAAYLTLSLIFSLLSTAAVVYTVASIYIGKEVSFEKVMSVVPKVWKRLMITFLSIFVVFFAYNVVFILAFSLVFIAWIIFIGVADLKVPYSFGMVLLVLYFVGIVYMTTVWQLASVVSVLEETCGFKAMTKSRALIKGKMWTAIVIFFTLSLSSAVINMAFQNLVVHGVSVNTASRVLYGVICLSLLLGLYLFGLVIQTVIYFVCKSYHHENIDKHALSDHLEVYHGEYVPLKSKDVQLEQYDV